MDEALKEFDLSRFTCTQCGNCCRMPGHVRLADDDVRALSARLKLSERAFVDSYTRLTDDRRGLSITENPDGSCIFLTDDNTCAVNDAKPRQCRNFPFTWRYTNVAEVCPGVRACRVAP